MADTATPATATVGADASDDAKADAILGRMAALEGEDDPSGDDVPERDDSGQPEREPDDDTSDDTDADEQPVEKPKTFRVKVQGEEIEVTQDELLKGYSREADYTRKTAQLAEQRRELERQVEQAKAEYAQKLNATLEQLGAVDPILSDARQTDWAKLAEENPAEYVAKQARVQQHLAKLNAVQAERANASKEAIAAATKKGREELVKHFPEWADDDKFQAAKTELEGTLTGAYGFRAEEIFTTDPRVLRVAHDAMQWQKHQAAQKAAAEKKVPQEPGKVLRPAADTRDRLDARSKNLKAIARKTGKLEDQAKFILSRL